MTQTSLYDNLVDYLHERVEQRDAADGLSKTKGKRPLKMPKDYDFSVRNVNWNEYKNDYLLRTDAVWEKSKLMDIFYTVYKSNILFDGFNEVYKVSDIRNMPLPTTEPEALEDWKIFRGYSNNDGCVWQFKVGPKLQSPSSLSRFVADKEGDTWYMCFLSFQKFMLCNERSQVKLDECNLYNQGFFEYPCYTEVE